MSHDLKILDLYGKMEFYEERGQLCPPFFPHYPHYPQQRSVQNRAYFLLAVDVL